MDEAKIASVIRIGLPGVVVSGRPIPVPKGFGSDSWRVRTSAGELLVKVRRREADAAKLRNQVEALRLARAGRVPVPELLYTGVSEALGGKPVMVLRYVSGVDAEEALPGMDARRRRALFSDLGTTVGRLHGISLPRFTDRIGTPEAYLDGWSEVVIRRAERAARRNREVGALDGAQISSIADRLGRDARAISDGVDPRLVHHDLYLANVLLRDGRFAALIDFEQAKGWDPLHDFIKLGMWVFDRHPESYQPFVAAYRRQTGSTKRTQARLATCLALENFVALGYWIERGDSQMAEISRAILRDWMAGSQPWWVQRLALDLS